MRLVVEDVAADGAGLAVDVGVGEVVDIGRDVVVAARLQLHDLGAADVDAGGEVAARGEDVVGAVVE